MHADVLHRRSVHMNIQGLHHITIACGNVQRTIDFYVDVLGLRLVKMTLTVDTPGTLISQS